MRRGPPRLFNKKEPEMTQCCIFDLDGVIVDTAKYHFLAWKEIAGELEITFTEKDNERLKGVSRMASLDILLSLGSLDLSEERKSEIAERKNKIYLEYIMKLKPEDLLPGVERFIISLKEKGVSIALGSASKNAVTILRQLEIESLFDAIADGNNVNKAKPDPEVFLKAASMLNKNSNDCIVFEDAIAGIEAAKAGGFKCIGVGNPELKDKTEYIINGFDDISKLEKIIERIDTENIKEKTQC